jgi:hypothetical protein
MLSCRLRLWDVSICQPISGSLGNNKASTAAISYLPFWLCDTGASDAQLGFKANPKRNMLKNLRMGQPNGYRASLVLEK